MKNVLMLSALILFFTPFIHAQEEQDEMMKAWQEYMTPGDMHKVLAKQVGEWKADMTMWNDPSSPPTKSQGTSKYEAILGGRYFQGTHKAEFMGMPMEGVETIGYDNAKKKFFSVWMDNFGTGVLLQEGDYDKETKTFSISGSTIDPMGRPMNVRQTSKYVDDDTIHMEMYMVDGEKEFKSMEIKFTRVK